jgi:hypothetical protein
LRSWVHKKVAALQPILHSVVAEAAITVAAVVIGQLQEAAEASAMVGAAASSAEEVTMHQATSVPHAKSARRRDIPPTDVGTDLMKSMF